MTGISSRTESFGSSGNINLEYKKNTFWKAYRLRRSAAVQVEAVVRRKETRSALEMLYLLEDCLQEQDN